MSVTDDHSAKQNSANRRRVRVSAHDVARLAGVSQSTVSRVLNKAQEDLISTATRLRVLEAARRLGYSPNPLASALRGKQSHLLGLIVRDISDPFFARITAEITTQARLQNYHIVLGHARSSPQEALEFTDILDARHTDGVFLLGDLQGDEAALQEMLRYTHALVALCRGPSPASLYTINSDNYAGTYALMDHLTGLGHRRIGFIDGGWLGDMRERGEAYRAYIEQHDLPLRAGWIQSEINDPQGGFLAMSRILALPERPTAVFASDDVMAIGAIKAAHTAGCQIPDQLSIVGFDDIEFSSYFCPALTTVRQPIAKMVATALDLMLRLISDPETMPEQKVIRLEPHLVVRQSSGPAAILHNR